MDLHSFQRNLILPLKQKNFLWKFNFTALFLNLKNELLESQVNEKVIYLWVDDATMFFAVIKEDLRRHLCFCRNWINVKVLEVLTHLTVSILGQGLFQIGIWDKDTALADAVSASSIAVDYSFQKCLFEIISKLFCKTLC